MLNKNKKQTFTDYVPNLEVPLVELVEQSSWSPGENSQRFVVVRGGLRVSDKDYPSVNEPRAIAEKDFWQRVIKRWTDGTRVEIVQYDKKKHRIW